MKDLYAYLVLILTLIALGIAGHEDYSAQLILDEPQHVVVAIEAAR